MYTDQIINAQYSVDSMNAIELSNQLKSNYVEMGIDVNEYNSENQRTYLSDKSIDSPPLEIYEYQNFFVVEQNEKIYLLDGYRRLLWYDVPNVNINVRVYKNLKDEQLLSIMLSLNHFKFFTKQNFYDRGFALFYKSFFDIDIFAIEKGFLGYLFNNRIDQGYELTKYGQEKINQAVEIMKHEFYLDNLRFLNNLSETYNTNIVNNKMGVFVKQMSEKYKTPIDWILFDEKLKNNETALELINKIDNLNDQNAIDKKVSLLLEYFSGFIGELNGEEVIKPHQDKINEIKEIEKQLKKEGFKVFSDNGKDYQSYIKLYGDKDKVKAVIYPVKGNNDYYGITDDVSFYYEKSRLGTNILNAKINDIKCDSKFRNYSHYYPMQTIEKNKKIKIYIKTK